MRIKVSELSGIALDWAVGKADNRPVIIGWSKQQKVSLLDEGYLYTIYSPSSDWSQGGPIIERENILIRPTFAIGNGSWRASPIRKFNYEENPIEEYSQQGKTPLIAAMRCYVASKLGEEVEIPNELINKE